MKFTYSSYSRKNRYYLQSIDQVLSFLIPTGVSILYFGRYIPDIMPDLDSSRCVIVSKENFAGREISEAGRKVFTCIQASYETFIPEETFDYIILNGALGESQDVCLLLKNLQKGCHQSTRLIVYQHNHLWQGFIHLAERLHLKKKGAVHNWVSLRDLNSYLNGMAYQVQRTFRQTLCPFKLGFVGPLINGLAILFPVFDFLKLNQYIVARPKALQLPAGECSQSLSIVLTVRDERGNIEPIVTSLPQICAEQEILFVEGHSSDGTGEEIERVIKLYPEKNIRVMTQSGKGQGDAIRVGFKAAQGDIIVLYEGDGTSSPEDIQYFYDAINSGRFEFAEGSRFIYPFDDQSMSLLKKTGNIFFACWFSWFLGQHTTDVLSGIKAITKKEYETIYAHWGFLGMEDPFGDFELLYGAFRFGLNICEIPMHYRPRPYGVSKSHALRHGFYLLRMAVRGFWMFRAAVVAKQNNYTGARPE